ncbi:MAG: polysaccharide deacetylase family protein [Bdellovibrio sp.]|jgi:peptidoglycan/xylan/chitin deacetylase (PgdA/CDA1 family)
MKASSWITKTVGLLLVVVPLMAFVGCKGDQGSSVKASGLSAQELFQKKNIGSFELTGTKRIALTYDDGPTPEVTASLLKLLRRYNIKATFFILGASVAGQERVLEQMRNDGHIIANHSYSHQNLASNLYLTDLGALMHQTQSSHDQIKTFMNPAHRLYFRAPYGAWTASHAAKLNAIPELAEYIGPVFWSAGGEVAPKQPRPLTADEIFSAADWDCWTDNPEKGIKPISVDVCAAGYLKEIERLQGGVILMHDKDMRTVQMTAKLLPKLIAAGYEFILLDEIRSLDKFAK